MGSFNRMVMSCFSTKWDASYSQLHPSVGAAAAGRKYVVGCHTPTISSDHSNRFSPISTTTRLDLNSRFLEAYDTLKSELTCDPFFEFDDVSRQWVDQMIDYNVPGGKMIRGLCVVNTYQVLKGEQLTDEEVRLACALGWSIEWLQAYFLVHDDIMDGSHTRRGQPCWFRLPKVEMIAVNDGSILRNHIHQILKKHFQGKSYYVHLLDLFNEAEYLTLYGQMIDLMSTQREKDLSKYSMSLYRRIAEHKSSYYSLYLPVACALLLSGEKLDDYVQVKDILVEMGIYCTVQDDYFDAFGDPNVIGKSGTDIENFKCSWLVVKALELANEEQKKILNENYGIKDPARIAKVKEIYNTLNLQGEYEDYENKTHEDFIRSIETHPSQEVQGMLRYLLGMIYKRQK